VDSRGIEMLFLGLKNNSKSRTQFHLTIFEALDLPNQAKSHNGAYSKVVPLI
jgi:hypothetical protein